MDQSLSPPLLHPSLVGPVQGKGKGCLLDNQEVQQEKSSKDLALSAAASSKETEDKEEGEANKTSSKYNPSQGSSSSSRRQYPPILARISTGNGLIKQTAQDLLGWTLLKKTISLKMSWDVIWAPSHYVLKIKDRLNALQKVNHFPGMSDLARKDFLASNLNAMQAVLPDVFNFFPPSYTLPR